MSISPSVHEETDCSSYGDTISSDEFRTYQRLALHVAKRYGHGFCKDFTFSEQTIRDVADRIIGIFVTESSRLFDPNAGVKFTTFLYRFLRFHTIKEYRSIILQGIVEFDSDALLERKSVDKEFDRIETDDAILFYATISDSEIKSIKRQYLPPQLQNMATALLKRTLGDLDREILQRLDGGENHNEIRNDFEQRRLGGRKFFRSRCVAIVRRGNFGKNF